MIYPHDPTSFFLTSWITGLLLILLFERFGHLIAMGIVFILIPFLHFWAITSVGLTITNAVGLLLNGNQHVVPQLICWFSVIGTYAYIKITEKNDCLSILERDMKTTPQQCLSCS